MAIKKVGDTRSETALSNTASRINLCTPHNEQPSSISYHWSESISPPFVKTLQLQHDLPGAITFEPFIGDGRPGDIAADMLEFCTLIGEPARRRSQGLIVQCST